ncbi:MAG: hypothetical protein WAV40_00160 [Microgenomates group bacterium]
MKKYLIIVSALVLLSCTGARAESDENVAARRLDQGERVQVQEIRTKSIAQNHADRLEKRFDLYYARLSDIISRFEKRLAILKASGKTVTEVETQLAAAKTKLEEAKTKGTQAVAAFEAQPPQLLVARDSAQSARKLFIEVHGLLKNAIKSLKQELRNVK